MLIGAALCAAALVAAARAAHARAAARRLGADRRSRCLTVFTALSITWSLMPSDSWLETNRTTGLPGRAGRRAWRSAGSRPAAGAR